MKSYRELKVWAEALTLAESVFRITKKLPKEEMFGLVAQLRRASVSIPSNIAEGHGRESTKDFLRFISIAMGSLAEVETQLELAARFGYLMPEETSAALSKADEIGKMLRGLQKALRNKL